MSNHEIGLPFWAVIPRKVESAPAHEPCGTPNHVVAFTDSDHALAYLQQRGFGEWRIQLIDKTGFMLFVADLHQLEMEAICFDPTLDGSEGTSVGMGELV